MGAKDDLVKPGFLRRRKDSRELSVGNGDEAMQFGESGFLTHASHLPHRDVELVGKCLNLLTLECSKLEIGMDGRVTHEDQKRVRNVIRCCSRRVCQGDLENE